MDVIRNHAASVEEDVELAGQVARLARLVRCAPRFADALSWWAGFPLRRQPRVPDEVWWLTAREARLLDLPPATPVTRRDGYLVSAIGPEGFRAGAVLALVHEPGLGLTLHERALMQDGTLPLSHIVRGCQRATHYAYRTEGTADAERPALQSRATLLLGGQPVALVWETVYWRLIRHRNPRPPPEPGSLLRSRR
jgi:hypothetical protein